MKVLRNLLRQKEPESAVLAKALADLQEPAAAAVRRLEDLQEKRRNQLFEAVDEPEIEETERGIAAAHRERDRLAIYAEELTKKVEQALEREKIDALMRRVAAAEKESEDLAAKVDAEMPAFYATVRELTQRHLALHTECQVINEALAAVGSTDRVIPRNPKVRVPTEIDLGRLEHGPGPSGYEGATQ